VLREGQNIDFCRDSRTTSVTLADHQWSAEQTLGITAVEESSESLPLTSSFGVVDSTTVSASSTFSLSATRTGTSVVSASLTTLSVTSSGSNVVVSAERS